MYLFQFPSESSRHILILPAIYPFLTFLIILKILKAREAEVIPTLTDYNLKRLLPLHMHPICLRTPAINRTLTKAPDTLSLASTPAIPTTIPHLRTGIARHPRQ